MPGLRLPPPPIHASSFRSDDLDDVRAFVARSDGEHSRVVHGLGRLAYERHALNGSRVGVCWGRIGMAQTIRGEVAALTLHLSIDASNDYLFGRRRIRVAPGLAMLVAPGREFTRRSDPGAVFALAIGERTVASEIEARRPDERGELAPTSRAIDLRKADRGAVETAIADFVAATASSAEARQRELGEARVISVVTELMLRAAAIPPASPLAAARFATLQAWIEAHLHESITLGRLCRIAAVSDRSLQLTFASLRGVSPMRYVNERRIAAARRLLMRDGASRGVTDIATSVGFAHLGRFAAMYRQTYGESPSQTRRS